MPRITVFTPSHNPKHLERAARSLDAQTYTDFEWIVLLNGKAAGESLPFARDYMRIQRVTAAMQYTIGGLKRTAIEYGRGDLFVELDHDDELNPTALYELANAADAAPDGFYYSDFIQVADDGTSWVFYADGWAHYEVPAGDGKMDKVCAAFESDPVALSMVYWAPNHVRCWSRKAYFDAGGHNPSLPICDDHDLVVRTYLTKAPFVHIPLPLYVYHSHANNEHARWHREHPGELNKHTVRIANDNFYALIHEWCRRRRLRMLDMSMTTSNWPKAQFANLMPLCQDPIQLPLDIVKLRCVEDNSVGCIVAVDFLDYLPWRSSMHISCEEFFELAHHKLAPGGFLLVRSRSTDGNAGFADPTVSTRFNQETFRNIPPTVPWRAKFLPNRLWQQTPSNFSADSKMNYVCVDMVALKGQRQAGFF